VNIEHGSYTVCLKGNIVVLQLFGEFNEYSVIAFTKKIQELVNQLNGEPFGILVDNLRLIGGTPEAYIESNKHNEWLASQALVAKATVYPSMYLTNVDALMVRSKSEINAKNFEDVNDAIAWLESFNRLSLECFNEHQLADNPNRPLVA